MVLAVPYSLFGLFFPVSRRSKQSRNRRRILSSVRRCRSRCFFFMIVIQSQLFSRLFAGDIQPFNSKLRTKWFLRKLYLPISAFPPSEFDLWFILALGLVLSFFKKVCGWVFLMFSPCLGYPGEEVFGHSQFFCC